MCECKKEQKEREKKEILFATSNTGLFSTSLHLSAVVYIVNICLYLWYLYSTQVIKKTVLQEQSLFNKAEAALWAQCNGSPGNCFERVTL